MGGPRGASQEPRAHPGEGESAEKLEPNQRRVESSCPNLQVTPRGGGGGGGGGRQKQQRLQRPEPAAARSASGRTGGELGRIVIR